MYVRGQEKAIRGRFQGPVRDDVERPDSMLVQTLGAHASECKWRCKGSNDFVE